MRASTDVTGFVNEKTRLGQTTATSERIRKDGLSSVEDIVTKDDKKNTVHTQRIIAAPLDRLWKVGLVSNHEFEAGDRFRTDAYLADVAKGAPTVDWGRPGGGSQKSFVPAVVMADRMREASARFEEARKAFSRSSRVWPVLLNALVHEHSFREIGHNVFGFRDEREATVAGRTAFCMALSVLADHYGL